MASHKIERTTEDIRRELTENPAKRVTAAEGVAVGVVVGQNIVVVVRQQEIRRSTHCIIHRPRPRFRGRLIGYRAN